MKTKSWQRLIGAKTSHLNTFDSEYIFDGNIVNVMEETRVWDSGICGSVFDIQDHDIHIMLAENGRYWKIDYGNRFAVNIIAFNRETKQAWPLWCLTAYDMAEVKENVKNLKGRLLKLTKEELIDAFAERKKMYNDWSEPSLVSS